MELSAHSLLVGTVLLWVPSVDLRHVPSAISLLNLTLLKHFMS